VVLDKTRTLPLGRPAVAALGPAEGLDEGRLLDIAAWLEVGSEHPLGEAVVRRAREQELGFLAVEGFESIAGRGVRGRVDGLDVVIGSGRLLGELGIDTAPLRERAEAAASDGSAGAGGAAGGAR